MSENLIRLTLDSGAFSAYNKKKEVDLDRYCRFIHDHAKLLHGYVNLDQIPGMRGMTRTSAHVEESAKKSWDNFCIMRKNGLEPVPVFHMGERWYWLEKMIDSGCKHIGLSPRNTLAPKSKSVWLDKAFTFLCGEKGYPEVKVHGFGMSAIDIAFRYPWYSIDAVTWMLYGAYGWCVVPQQKPGGGYDYTRPPIQLGFSTGSTNGKLQPSLGGNRHVATMGAKLHRYVKEYVEGEGFDLDDVLTSTHARQRLHVRFYRRAGEAWTPRPFHAAASGLFADAPSSGHGRSKPLPDRFRILFTVGTSEEASQILNEEKLYDRLLTYWYFRDDSPPFSLRKYVATGKVVKRKRHGKQKSASL